MPMRTAGTSVASVLYTFLQSQRVLQHQGARTRFWLTRLGCGSLTGRLTTAFRACADQAKGQGTSSIPC